MKILKKTVGIRITSQEEEVGIDSVSFGVKSYSNE
jgi:ammonia channel protein AmtB